MFKKKSLVVKVVEDKKIDPEPVVEKEPVDYKQLNEDITVSVVTVIGAYFLFDTLRHIAIHTAATHIK